MYDYCSNCFLGFIAADSKDTGTSTEYWLVCEYHEKGSLFNYLQTHALHLQTMLKMIFGIVCGLNHLHMQITGSQGKPPIAHRDMKTKNILVKSDSKLFQNGFILINFFFEGVACAKNSFVVCEPSVLTQKSWLDITLSMRINLCYTFYCIHYVLTL